MHHHYDPKQIETKWQAFWAEHKTFATPEDVSTDNKEYILPQLPYPSGSGLHVGHSEVYTACDIYARYQRMVGKKVLQVIGWDSFGLPAENYAIKTNVHPKISTDKAIDNFRQQITSLGISVDWDREVGSHNADYYKWTQWFFLLMYKQGLAYRKAQAVNWCESCKTVLANAQVVDGHCERCDTVVIQKEMEQWYLRITDYADKLLEGLDRIDWPEETKKRQRDWIGKSEGAEIQFQISNSKFLIDVFTTRPDTIFGATYMVLAPEHVLVHQLKNSIENWDEVHAYIEATSKKTDLERQVDQEKTGVELKGVMAINPVNGEEIPVWIADYVLASYGTGAIMAVPAHDERDFAFAKKFGLAIREVVTPLFRDRRDNNQWKDGAPIVKRKTIQAFVKHWSEDKYLCLDWGNLGVRSGIIGGIKDGEDMIEGAAREIIEETGYQHPKFVQLITKEFHSHYYTPHKGENRHALVNALLFELENDVFVEPTEEHTVHHKPVWVEASNMHEFLNIPDAEHAWNCLQNPEQCFVGHGLASDSDFLNDLETAEAKEKIIQWLEKEGVGKGKVQYKLRDWSVSRQRFWGAPIPMLYDDKGALHSVPEEDLPVELPDDVDFKPTGQSPLTYSESFQSGVEEKYGKGWKREVDTLDTFMCSSWYYYRYLDPKNDGAFASPEALKKWMPVDFYLGGAEHVNGHLLYSRFFTKVLHDAGYIDFDEPFTVHRHQGLILGEDNRKMSKRWGNVVNPTDVVNEYGADTCRVYEMFMGPLEDDKPWNTQGVKGVRRFLDRVWRLFVDDRTGELTVVDEVPNKDQEQLLHKTIKKVGSDTASLQFNTAVACMMEFVNAANKWNGVPKDIAKTFVLLLSPYAPHIAEELWQKMGGENSLALESFPQVDESKLVTDSMMIVIQVNGKVRDKIEVAADEAEDEIKSQALAREKIQSWLDGNDPKKVIYVKDKLVSIVV